MPLCSIQLDMNQPKIRIETNDWKSKLLKSTRNSEILQETAYNKSCYASFNFIHNHWIFAAFEEASTVVPTKSDSDVIFCYQLLSKTLTWTLHLS